MEGFGSGIFATELNAQKFADPCWEFGNVWGREIYRCGREIPESGKFQPRSPEFGTRSSELEARKSRSLGKGTFVAESRSRKFANLSRVFAIVGTDGSMDVTDRSLNGEDSGPRGLKVDNFRGLEIHNVVKI